MVAWNGLTDGVKPVTGGYSLLVNEDSNNTGITRLMRQPGMRKAKALLAALIGAAAGGTATGTTARVEGITSVNGLGGKRNVETVTAVNRATTAADVTALKAVLAGRAVAPSYTNVEKSGNNSATAFKGK